MPLELARMLCSITGASGGISAHVFTHDWLVLRLFCLAAAGIAACKGSDKVRAHAVRALGYILASPSLPGAMAADEAGCSEWQDRQSGASTSGRASAPAWFQPSVQQLQEALRTGKDKVAWNACYAVGGLLRNRTSTELAQESGCLHPLLLELLSVLQHSRNHKACRVSRSA